MTVENLPQETKSHKLATPTFATQAPIFLEQLQTRKRHPVKPATLVAYQGAISNWIVPAIGEQELESFGNGALKTFIQGLATKELAPATINLIVGVVKSSIASATTSEGDPLYPRTWNNDFLDLPDIGQQKSPAITMDQLEAALQSPHGLFYAFLAGTGLRVGEALAVRYGDDGVHSAWDPENAVLHVRTQLWQRQEIAPKTLSGIREVDLDPRLNALLLKMIPAPSAPGTPLFHINDNKFMWESSLRKYSLKTLGIPGFHTFRRYRITRLRELGVREDIVRYWVGHADESTTDLYSKLAENKELRKQWAKRAGLGFDLADIAKACVPQPKPKPKSPKPTSPTKPTRAEQRAAAREAKLHSGIKVVKTLVRRKKRPSLAERIQRIDVQPEALRYTGVDEDLPATLFELAPVTEVLS